MEKVRSALRARTCLQAVASNTVLFRRVIIRVRGNERSPFRNGLMWRRPQDKLAHG